jgi:hypothetical protein
VLESAAIVGSSSACVRRRRIGVGGGRPGEWTRRARFHGTGDHQRGTTACRLLKNHGAVFRLGERTDSRHRSANGRFVADPRRIVTISKNM